MKFAIHTYGCQMNVRDSEAVESLMVAAGHEPAANEQEAELVIINSCTVRQKAEEKAVGKAGNMIAEGKIVGLMGCAVKRMGEDVFKRLPKLDFAVGPRMFGMIPKIVAELGKGGERLFLGDDNAVPEARTASVRQGSVLRQTDMFSLQMLSFLTNPPGPHRDLCYPSFIHFFTEVKFTIGVVFDTL